MIFGRSIHDLINPAPEIDSGGAALAAAMGAGARTNSGGSGSGLLALSAAAVNAATDERALQKIQGKWRWEFD